MNRRSLARLPFSAFVFATLRNPLFADFAHGDARLQRLFSSYMAPCCWRENLSVHHSPKADELRAQIQGAVAKGLSDEQIKEKMIAEFSRQILAQPEGSSGLWLKYGPWAAGVGGLAALVWGIRASLRKSANANPGTGEAIHLPDLDEV